MRQLLIGAAIGALLVVVVLLVLVYSSPSARCERGEVAACLGL